MKRRILSILTALALCLSLFPAGAWAAEGEPPDGSEANSWPCGDGVTATLVDGTLTISGTGPMVNYEKLNTLKPWNDHLNSIQNVVIEDGVTSIGDYAFCKLGNLTSVTISKDVTSIGGYAFYRCTSLSSIRLPSGLTSIDSLVFSGCSALTSIDIPSDVTSIGTRAFEKSGLTEVKIPSNVTTIGDLAFLDCRFLKKVEIPNSVDSISDRAFMDSLNAEIYYAGTQQQWDAISKGSGFPNKVHTLHTVTIADGGADASGEGTYSMGDPVTVSAGAKENHIFAGWTATGLDTTGLDLTNSSLTFPMPEEDVALTATWKTTAVAKVGDILYPTVQAAFDAAAEIAGGGTVTLLKDVDVGETSVTMDKGTITLEGSGRILSGSSVDGGTIGVTGGALIVGNVKVENTDGGYGIRASQANLTVKEGAEVSAISGVAIDQYSGTLTITGGTINGDIGLYVVEMSGGVEVHLSGGSISGTESAIVSVASLSLGDMLDDGCMIYKEDGTALTADELAEGSTGPGTFTVRCAHSVLGDVSYSEDGAVTTVTATCATCQKENITLGTLTKENYEQTVTFGGDETVKPFRVTAEGLVITKYEWSMDGHVDTSQSGSEYTPYSIPGETHEYTCKVTFQTSGGSTSFTKDLKFTLTTKLMEVTEDMVTVTLASDNVVYDGTNQMPDVTKVCIGEQDVTDDNNSFYTICLVDTPDGDPSGGQINAGTYYIWLIFHNPFTGTVTLKEPTFTITPAPLTVKANDQTITYGGSLDDTEVTCTGLCTGDSLKSITLTASSDQVAVADKTITPSAAQIQNASGADVTGNYKITYETGALTITKDISATAPSAGEGYTLDYTRETIAVEKGYEVSTANDGSGTAVPNGGSITAHLGKALYIRKMEDDNHAASGWTAFTPAARPAAPALTVQGETLKGKSDGQLTGDGTGTEYSTDGGATWKDYADGAFSNLAGGTALQVRVKATAGNPHGAEGSYTIAEGKTITVTFDSQGGSAVSDVTGLTYEAVVTPPEPPTRTDYKFLGWYKDQAGTTEWDFDTKLTTETVTLYAKWKQVNFTVGGTVKNDANSPVSGATVKLMQGSSEKDQGTTGADGKFAFSKTIPAGAYNIVTTYNGQAKTTLITITDSDMNDVEVQLPPEGVNSELEVKPNTPAVVVGGLDEEAISRKDEGSTVTVSMAVDGKQEAAVPAEQVSAIKEAAEQSGTSDPVVEYLDVTVTKEVDGTSETISTTNKVIKIVVPFDFGGKSNVAVVRYHDNKAEKLNAVGTETDGTYQTDEANGFLYIYAMQFSTYAVAYEVTRYTVTFDASGSTVSPASSKTTSAGTLSTLPTPARSGYSFTGWYTSGGTKVTTSTVFKEDTTIYARWQQDAPPPPPVDPTVPVRGISLDKTSLTLTVGQTERLIAAIQPSNATNKSVVWSSGDPSVAAVDSNGNVTARAPGTAVITVRTVSGGYRATCTVTVRASEPGHVHEWSADWTTDATHHWHECLAEGCGITGDSEKDGYGVHVYDNKQDTDCNVCGHIRTVAPPDPDHVHRWDSAWSGDSIHHWHECLAEGCGITADSEKDGYGWHIPGAWTTDYPATSTMAGRRYRACTVCGRILETASIPATGGSSGGGGSSVRTYAITVEKPEHGKVTASRMYASSGTTVTLTATADAGYVLLDLTVTDSQGNVVTLTEKNTFTMPGRAVTVKASFAPLPDENQEKPCDGGAGCPSGAYADLDTGTWYHEAVDYAIRKGLLTGYGNGTFNPNGNLSRAQLAQILYNMEGRPRVKAGSGFVDVAPDSWYAGAVTWAAAQGIVGGYGNGRFGPNDSITREQLAVMLWRYNKEPAATDRELHFSDADRARGYALEALRWAAENGVISGKGGGVLDPSGTATRAETAQMLKNFLENQ